MDSLWIDFVNSDWRDYRGTGRREDRLESPAWVRAFLRRWDLGPVNLRGRAARDALRELRGLIQRLVAALVKGKGLSDRDLAALNAHLTDGPVVTRLERDGAAYRVRLLPTKPGLRALMFQIASSFASFLVEGDPARLKLCNNPDCRWVFYDTTRSRTRRWCEDACGNLMKVRRFRAKKPRGG